MSQTRSFKPSPLIHFSNSHYNTHTVYTYTSKFCGNTCQSFMDIFMFLVVESCLTLCNPMDYSMPRFPVLHHLPEFAQTMPTESVMLSNHLILYHSLFLLPSIFPSIRVFFNELALCHQVAKVLELQLQASFLPMNIQDWFPSEWTGWISLQSKGLSRVFSSTTIQKHQFFGVLPSLWFNSHIHTWLLEKP